MEVVRFKNRHAEFELTEKTVRKKYFENYRNEKESKSLFQMQDLYKDFNYEGWSYELVKLYEGSRQEGLLMNRIKGKPMIEDEGFQDNYYFHAGLWLGHFHSLSQKGFMVKTFGDFTLPNIFINKEDKIITALDPNGKAMTDRNYFFDILTFIKISYINKLKINLKYNEKCVDFFIKGYNVCNDFKYDEQLFDDSLELILPDLKAVANRRHNKVKAYLGSLLIGFHMKYKLKKFLSKY